MKNPLNKRLPRELKSELGKYIILFVFITAMIAAVSGILVAGNSMQVAYDESFDKYNIEDGNFELSYMADPALVNNIENLGVTLYENFYLDEETDYGTTMRVFKNREYVNKVCLMSGEFPVNENEIAIDRVHANNNDLKIEDIIVVGGKEFKITGLVALTDYSTLYQNPQDTMFDAIKFGVSVVTKEGFEGIGDTHIHYSYSWKYDTPPADDSEAKTMSEDFLKKLYSIVALENYIPAYSNQAIHFSGDDLGSDLMMITVFLYILIVIIAFIFAITTSNTIAKEATVIGTLRASGYTRGELIRHYLTVPMMVTLFSAIVGNILGYTLLKDYGADMYYKSFGFTTYETLWNWDAFINTTVIPLVIMFLINFLILLNKFRLSPLRFIRRDIGKKKKKKAFKLNTKIGIMKRFRLRIIFQNMPNYITIIIGVLLANVIMVFGNVIPELLTHYGDTISESMICDYQYILKMPAPTDNENAESFTAYTLKTLKTKGFTEDVTIYGICEESQYIDVDFEENTVYISSAYADKYNVEKGDTITLKEEFADTEYKFKVGGIYDYSIGIAVFMDKEELNRLFGFTEGYFNGYFSNEELKDVDERAVATVITEEDMTKLTRQMMNSMGNMMDMFFVLGVVIFMLIIYLLSKIVIEKNAQSISMIKILGYTGKEINGLYVVTTAIVVIASLILTMPLVNAMMGYMCEIMFFTYSGWLTYYMPVRSMIIISVTGIISYAVIAFAQMQNVKKIPMEDALKNVE